MECTIGSGACICGGGGKVVNALCSSCPGQTVRNTVPWWLASGDAVRRLSPASRPAAQPVAAAVSAGAVADITTVAATGGSEGFVITKAGGDGAIRKPPAGGGGGGGGGAAAASPPSIKNVCSAVIWKVFPSIPPPDSVVPMSRPDIFTRRQERGGWRREIQMSPPTSGSRFLILKSLSVRSSVNNNDIN